MRKIILIFVTLFGVLSLYAGSEKINSIVLNGKIVMKGCEPHAYLVIEDIATNKDYKIEKYKEFKLEKKQNKRVKLKAIIIKEAIGPGFPAVVKVVDAEGITYY